MRIGSGIALALTALLLGGASSRALATTFTVTKTADTNDGVCDADCSLREAIIAANANPGADTIVLGSGLTYTLTLGPPDAPGALVAGSGDLDITDAVSIEGMGSTIDGGALDRVFDISGNFDVTIDNLKITSGVAAGFLSLGGGLRVRNARVVLNNCIVSNNATALEGGFRDDGGGIAVIGSFDAATGTATLAHLTLNGSTVTSNHGLNGGGVLCALCALTVTNSTISANVADGDGGGIDLLGNASTLNMSGSNVVNNTAARGGAVAIPFGTSASTLSLNRITGNSAALGAALFNNFGSSNVDNNWWGCNYGPGGSGANCFGSANGLAGLFTMTRYLVLNVNAPSSAQLNQPVTVTADLTKNNLGNDTSPAGSIPDGTRASFAGTNGTFATPTAGTSGGKATDVFTPTAAGTATITVNVDGQTVLGSLTVHPPWTDDPIVPGVTLIKAIHISELRSRIDAVRTTWSLGAYAYTTPTLVDGSTFVQAQHIIDLRTALAQAYTAAGRTPPAYTDPALAPDMFVKAVHIMELRGAVVAIE